MGHSTGLRPTKNRFSELFTYYLSSIFSFISNLFGIISHICGYTYLRIELRKGQPNVALLIRGFYNCPMHTLKDMRNNYKPNGNEGHKWFTNSDLSIYVIYMRRLSDQYLVYLLYMAYIPVATVLIYMYTLQCNILSLWRESKISRFHRDQVQTL